MAAAVTVQPEPVALDAIFADDDMPSVVVLGEPMHTQGCQDRAP